MLRLLLNFITTILLAIPVPAQQKKSPKIDYILSVDTADLSGYNVILQIRNVPHVFKLALATHHEYDDRFWRFVQNFNISTREGNGSYIKSDSAVWQVTIPGHDAIISYRLHLPLPGQFRFAHRPFLSAMGGLVGDIHSFMYLPDNINIASTVTFQLPGNWQIATGLEPTKKRNVFIASSAEVLLDCPVVVGQLSKWSFNVNGIKHTVVYLPTVNASAFDSKTLISSIQKIVQQAVKTFGSMPYANYTFLLEDGVNGALEHRNSVTIGAPSAMLATNMKELYEELAHEFFHTWNLMSIKPAEYTSLNYGPQQMSAALWFSEGFTMFYADLLLRRAGLPTADIEDSTRISHLQSLMNRYYTDTGNTVIPPGKVSLASNASPGMLGDYDASTHLQGELLATIIDLMIRDASENKKSLDDVMKLIFKEFGNKKGFFARDIEKAVKSICSCNNKVDSFFKNYIYDGHAIEFNRYLKLLGLRFYIAYVAKNVDGKLLPDLRVYIWQPIGDTLYHIGVTNPVNCWARSGIHTGDVIFSLNDHTIKTRQDFYNKLNTLHINDTLRVVTRHNDNNASIPVIITGYDKPVVSITQIPNASTRQQKLFDQWERGN
jgi:predicted metalloprotease with PDZ domain